MAITAADLNDFIENILHASRLIHNNLAAEHSITQAELSLTVVTEGVQLASFRDNGRVQVAALDSRNRMRGLKVKQLWTEELLSHAWALATLTL